MNRRVDQFERLLLSYPDAHSKRTVALDFAQSFIEDGNVCQILAVLASVSTEVKNIFLERVALAPQSEEEWQKLFVVGAEMSEADCLKAKSMWRLCVERVRREIKQSDG